MNAEEIRNTFSHNEVYGCRFDESSLVALQVLAMGELAAQIAELRESRAKDALSHLSVALTQALPSDDQIIIGHIQSAHDILKAAV